MRTTFGAVLRTTRFCCSPDRPRSNPTIEDSGIESEMAIKAPCKRESSRSSVQPCRRDIQPRGRYVHIQQPVVGSWRPLFMREFNQSRRDPGMYRSKFC
jgi:hypothetical protein